MMSVRRARPLMAALLALVLALAPMSLAEARGPKHAPPPDTYLPIVFVHGQSGSAQQFESQALRFTSAGYPQELLFAYEYDTSTPTNDLQRLDAFIDRVLAETGADQVYAIGHSRGTTVMTSYLFPDEGGVDGSAKVAKYVNIDGRSPEELPGGVPTIGIWGEWNTAGSGFNRRGDTNAQIGPDPAANFHYADKGHTEVATSPEAFFQMFRFFTGEAPATTDVVAEPPGRVTISGRAVLFPQNVGYAGSTVEVWRVDPETGLRKHKRPEATFPIDEDGDWGPVRVHGKKHYELAIVRPEGGVHHFYFEPFIRSNHFVRLNSSRPGEGLSAVVPTSPATTHINVIRMREMWGDQGEGSDRLFIDGISVVEPNTSPRAGVNLALFAFDAGGDLVTDVEAGPVPPFGAISFITAVDVAIPADPEGRDPVSVTQVVRGDEDHTVTVNVPNWPSSTDAVSVQFRDFTGNTK
jgi:pimeloyl-ACP methyl ester carboxylesterase